LPDTDTVPRPRGQTFVSILNINPVSTPAHFSTGTGCAAFDRNRQ
jgi:hypothetical protein